MKDPKNIPLLLIPYLTICGALYHIAYWGTFGINGLSFITISDIIKSFIHPFLLSTFSLFFGSLIGSYFPTFFFKTEINQENHFSNNENIKGSFGFKYFLPIFIILNIIITPIISSNPYKWILFGYFLALPLAILADIYGLFIDVIKKITHRTLFFQLFFYLPVFSFCIGEYNSEIIFQNRQYKYTINHKIDDIRKCNINDTFKLLGNTEKHFVFTNLSNEKTFFIKNENIDTLILLEKK